MNERQPVTLYSQIILALTNAHTFPAYFITVDTIQYGRLVATPSC